MLNFHWLIKIVSPSAVYWLAFVLFENTTVANINRKS